MTKKETKFIQKYLEYYQKYGDDIPTDGWNFLSRYRKSLGIDYQRSKILIEEAVRSYEESNNEKISDPKIKTKRDYNEISAQLRAAIKQIQKIPSSTNEFQKIKQSFVDTLSAQLSRTLLEKQMQVKAQSLRLFAFCLMRRKGTRIYMPRSLKD